MIVVASTFSDNSLPVSVTNLLNTSCVGVQTVHYNDSKN